MEVRSGLFLLLQSRKKKTSSFIIIFRSSVARSLATQGNRGEAPVILFLHGLFMINRVQTTALPPSPPHRPLSRSIQKKSSSGIGDAIFKNLTIVFALSILVIMAAIAWQLIKNSGLARHAFGWAFLGRQIWDPVAEQFGALPFIYGTLLSSLIALAIAVPLGIGVAIFLSELAPPKVSETCAFLIELLAAIPSVVYGLIGGFVLLPWLPMHLQPF